MPKVSVLCASYNHADFIGASIESVLGQTFSDLELLITDDASSDRSVDVINSYQDRRLKHFVNSRNRGVCASSGNSYQHSSGEYIAWLGSDDVFEPDMLAVLVEYLERNPDSYGVFGLPTIIDEKGNATDEQWHPNGLGLTRYELLRMLFGGVNPFCATAALVRRSAMQMVGYRAPHLLQLGDLEHWVRMLCQGPLDIIERKVVRKRNLPHLGNLSSPSAIALHRTQFELFEILLTFAEHMQDLSLLKAVFPDAEKSWPLEHQYVPLHLARQALEVVGSSPHKLFALHVYFNEIKTMDGLERLSRADFDYGDLFSLEAKNWIFMGVAEAASRREMECLSEANDRLSRANADLEAELKRTQALIGEMVATRIWKLGNALRKLKGALGVKN